ncbi:aminopeptidase [Desulfonema magnum]|uniref:M18 family aminopeptidase n=1 Tax=Desulfonema magnum TaxID=45655 RepID=A0A975BQI3_9BACT|nr:aminopeptidase [Desulfonema magnum]QTA89215.1 Zinc metallopeptidase M18 domain-containing protein [Desulfonema magnum]
MNPKLSKKEIENLRKHTAREPSLAWDVLSKNEKDKVFKFAEAYKTFLDTSKTEREAVSTILEMAQKNGFENIDEGNSNSGKFYKIHRDKAIALGIIGKKPMADGVRIIGAHIDSPRLDLKQNPLYEETDMAFLKTHYYGGIRKYQWLARPLAIHGKIIKNDGKELNLSIGESEDDPVFTILDLLPHLAGKIQGDKKLSEAFEGEKLNVVVGSLPLGDKETKERFKLSILHYLYETYGMIEEDFISAEIEIVPAGNARDIGLDRSLIGAYGQDDRICAFSALEAIREIKRPDTTSVALFFDKEEIGSEGNTGAKSRFLEEFVSDLLVKAGSDASERSLRKTLINSMALSADVNGALDPDFQEVHEKRNAARLGYGVCITKFTGSGGKSGSSDASAEYMGVIRKIFNKSNVVWQTGELGKIDQGGGGTIAKYLAVYGMEIVDCGPALIGMHSPLEIASKADLYMTFKANKAFFSAKG